MLYRSSADMPLIPEQPERALAAAYSSKHAINDIIVQRHTRAQQTLDRLPRLSTSRLASSSPQSETVLYLAYGSNLSAEKFLGDRGIRPLGQINVQVPSLRLTFDLPGLPYLEPCFANSARRTPSEKLPDVPNDGEKRALACGDIRSNGYRKNRWHKGLIGVVYEVTTADYTHIIATEGGGSGYQDILVDCHPFATSDPSDLVPDQPTLPAFKAHTLFAPATPEGDDPPTDGGHLARPDPDYAQASARYLKLITDGAAECELPYEYQDYLLSLQPYTATTRRQKMGQFVFSITWVPIIFAMIALGRQFVDEDGKLPVWMRKLMGYIFEAVWASYDGIFHPLFGDGERTLGDDGNTDTVRQLARARHMRQMGIDLEKGTIL